MWEEIQPRRYQYQITPEALICAVMTSFALRLAGLRDIWARFKSALGSDSFSSLSHAMGLAHLYNFSQTGILFLLHTALLFAMLLFLSQPEVNEEVIAILRRALKEVRACLGLGGVWKRNTISGTRAKRSSKNH